MYDKKAAKQRYFDRVYDEAPMIECACGCKTLIKSKDKYARDVCYVSGHNGRKYEDPSQRSREWNHNHREERQVYKMDYYRRKKVELIYYKGGKCQRCAIEYNGKNAGMYQFHHRDPKEKEFQIAQNITNYKWERVLKEVDKCDLLCGNCHLLEHSTEF